MWIITGIAVFLLCIYLSYQKGRKLGRKETTWLQKMSLLLMQALSGYPRPHLAVILITEDNILGKGNKRDYPECPEGFSLCVLLEDMPTEPETGEAVIAEYTKTQIQLDYLYTTCHDFEKAENVRIESKLFTRTETVKNKSGDNIKVWKNLVFLKVDT